jgi:hypothetical protein
MQKSSEHINSYYAATVNWQTDYPLLAGEHRCDVAVVGAGFTGLSTALYATGYSGHGLAPTHIAGQILADAICGDAERFDVFARIRHWKLPGGKWFANPALALGMLYYRLKEIL